jgi:hypothetical protein
MVLWRSNGRVKSKPLFLMQRAEMVHLELCIHKNLPMVSIFLQIKSN